MSEKKKKPFIEVIWISLCNDLKYFITLFWSLIPIGKHREYSYALGIAVALWLRCCATNRKVAGSIPDGVIGIFH